MSSLAKRLLLRVSGFLPGDCNRRFAGSIIGGS